MVADFLYAPIMRYHMREVALKFPYFPGQVWFLPHLGEVKIVGVTDDHINYTVLDSADETNYFCKRRDFAVFAHDPNELKKNVVSFNLIKNKEER